MNIGNSSGTWTIWKAIIIAGIIITEAIVSNNNWFLV